MDVYQVLDKFARRTVLKRRGIVIGSETPWLEAFLLEFGASQVTTLEFGAIKSTHPQISTFTPQDFTIKFLQGEIAPFDFGFSFSSIEHDGLGRYGDVLNPAGDLETMARMLHVIKPGGFFFLAVPCCVDALKWNAHRIYGPLRLKYLFAGWKIVTVVPENVMQSTYSQPVWVLQNTVGCKESFDFMSGIWKFKDYL